jgi:hypothetical protein
MFVTCTLRMVVALALLLALLSPLFISMLDLPTNEQQWASPIHCQLPESISIPIVTEFPSLFVPFVAPSHLILTSNRVLLNHDPSRYQLAKVAMQVSPLRA